MTWLNKNTEKNTLFTLFFTITTDTFIFCVFFILLQSSTKIAKKRIKRGDEEGGINCFVCWIEYYVMCVCVMCIQMLLSFYPALLALLIMILRRLFWSLTEMHNYLLLYMSLHITHIQCITSLGIYKLFREFIYVHIKCMVCRKYELYAYKYRYIEYFFIWLIIV